MRQVNYNQTAAAAWSKKGSSVLEKEHTRFVFLVQLFKTICVKMLLEMGIIRKDVCTQMKRSYRYVEGIWRKCRNSPAIPQGAGNLDNRLLLWQKMDFRISKRRIQWVLIGQQQSQNSNAD